MTSGKEHQNEAYPRVWLHSDLSKTQNWQGQIVRTEGIIEKILRQLHVVAQIKNTANNKKPGELNLIIGQYVHAKI